MPKEKKFSTSWMNDYHVGIDWLIEMHKLMLNDI